MEIGRGRRECLQFESIEGVKLAALVEGSMRHGDHSREEDDGTAWAMGQGQGVSAVWCGMVRCGVVWCGVVRWCVVWCGVWCGVMWCGEGGVR